jgi:DNA-binding GntR family transcriptional regulator
MDLANRDKIDLAAYIDSSLVDVVTKQIRTNIYNGVYEPGQKLIVRELSEELGVSHTPIKDALNRLVAEGYVEALPRKSMVVKEHSNHDFIERLEIRLMCELYCVNAVIENAKKDESFLNELKKIEEEIEEIYRAEKSIDREKWIALDGKFHRVFMQQSANQQLIKVYEGLDIPRFRYFAFLQNNHRVWGSERFEYAQYTHSKIISAIEQKSKELLRQELISDAVNLGLEHAQTEEDKKKVLEIKKIEPFV